MVFASCTVHCRADIAEIVRRAEADPAKYIRCVLKRCSVSAVPYISVASVLQVASKQEEHLDVLHGTQSPRTCEAPWLSHVSWAVYE